MQHVMKRTKPDHEENLASPRTLMNTDGTSMTCPVHPSIVRMFEAIDPILLYSKISFQNHRHVSMLLNHRDM